MAMSLVATSLAITALTILIRRLYIALQRRRIAQKAGCQAINQYPHTHPLGFDLFRERAASVQAGRRNGFDLDLFRKHGATYECRISTKRIINTIELANFQAVTATQFQDFGRDSRKAIEPLFGQGILSINGPQWRRTRDLVTPLFKRAELNDVERFEKFVERMLKLIPHDGSTFDMQPLLQKLFLDNATEFIFGESIDSLRDISGEAEEFLESFNRALAGAGKRLSMGGAFSIIYMFETQWKKDCSKLHAFIDSKIAKYRRALDVDATRESKERYVLIEGMAKEIKDPVELRFHLLNIFFPAKDSAAVAVSNALFFLSRQPHLWDELRSEALALGDKKLTFELLKSLPKHRYTLFEAIRLQGPSGQIQRVALRDTTIPKGGGPDGSAPAFVPKGTLVYLNTFPRNRDTSVWGDDVEEFRPSRFEGKFLGWEFTPFSGGPRICPAINQVIAQSVYLLVRLVRAFEAIECRDECWSYVEATRMLVESRNGVKIALAPAK